MIKYLSFTAILALRLFYQPAHVQLQPAPFSAPSAYAAVASAAVVPAKLLEFRASLKNNKVMLNWSVSENETADQFIVEKSTDGIKYAAAALVFGSDKPSTDNYEYYEKAGNRKVSYRIKLVNKNNKTEYSEVVEIDPANG